MAMRTYAAVVLGLGLAACGGAAAVPDTEPAQVAESSAAPTSTGADTSGPTLNVNTSEFEVEGIRVIHKNTPGNMIVSASLRFDGGATTWTNVVAACSPCNLRKGGQMPAEARMHPKQVPFEPTVYELHNNGRLFPPNHLHESWMDYLYWDVELEP